MCLWYQRCCGVVLFSSQQGSQVGWAASTHTRLAPNHLQTEVTAPYTQTHTHTHTHTRSEEKSHIPGDKYRL